MTVFCTTLYNQRLHAIITLLLVRTTCIYCCSSCTSHLWWITQSTQRQRRGCNSTYSQYWKGTSNEI